MHCCRSIDDDDDLSETEREKLDAAIDRSFAEIDAGLAIPFDLAMASLKARQGERSRTRAK